MATTAGDIYVRSGASGSFTSVQYVQGGWTTVPSASDMTGIYHDRLRDGQVIWVEHTEQLYVTRKFVAFSTPGYDGTDDSASFHTTNLGISGGGGGGAGDITSVVAGNGLSGTSVDTTQGEHIQTLTVGSGDGIEITTGAVNIDEFKGVAPTKVDAQTYKATTTGDLEDMIAAQGTVSNQSEVTAAQGAASPESLVTAATEELNVKGRQL